MNIEISDETRALYEQLTHPITDEMRQRAAKRQLEELEIKSRQLEQLVGVTRAKRLAIARERGTHTQDEWQAVLWIWDYRCARCGISSSEHRKLTGKRLTKDHITSLCSPGCSDGIGNIQPLCIACNAQKGMNTKDYMSTPVRQYFYEMVKECVGFFRSLAETEAEDERQMERMEIERQMRLAQPQSDSVN